MSGPHCIEVETGYGEDGEVTIEKRRCGRNVLRILKGKFQVCLDNLNAPKVKNKSQHQFVDARWKFLDDDKFKIVGIPVSTDVARRHVRIMWCIMERFPFISLPDSS